MEKMKSVKKIWVRMSAWKINCSQKMGGKNSNPESGKFKKWSLNIQREKNYKTYKEKKITKHTKRKKITSAVTSVLIRKFRCTYLIGNTAIFNSSLIDWNGDLCPPPSPLISPKFYSQEDGKLINKFSIELQSHEIFEAPKNQIPYMINTGNEYKKSQYPGLAVWCETILTCMCWRWK